ncbi:helix-turn-helix domain-containing protein [Candidatus Pseudoruminococcus sp.]|uniref:helix-turn-helix domain-containing protein n=1 Tax=Candidatus Pseudoruminococcus sp. TaxID=3101048 RepID=UPI00399A0503
MTKEQKALVVKLRDQGMTFAAIAEKLDISVNSIKSFYRRNSNTSNASNDENQLCCKECGKPIIQPFGTREKKFCSDKCRMLWWNTRRSEVKLKSADRCKCSCCGKEFQAYAQRKFCSRGCYFKMRFGGGDSDKHIKHIQERKTVSDNDAPCTKNAV